MSPSANTRASFTAAAASIALIATLGLAGCFGWSVSEVGPTGPTDGARGNASLSDAGVKEIARAGAATFDWSSGRLLLRSVGLTGPGDFANAVSARDRSHPIQVTVRAPNTTIRVSSERIFPYVAEGSDEIGELWLTAGAETDEQFLSLVRDFASLAGAENEGLHTWLAAYADDPRATCNTLGYFTPEGTTTGLRVWLGMSCKWDPEPRRFVSVHIAPLEP